MYRKLKHKSSIKIKPVLFVVIGLMLVAVIAVIILLRKDDPKLNSALPTNPIVKQENDIDYDPPTQEQKDTSNQQKDEIVKDNDSNPTTDASLAVTITRLTQDPSGLNIRTVVTGTSSGNCQITITKSGQPTVTKTFPVVMDATSANCQNTPIATSEFSTGGTWNVQIVVVKGTSQSNPTNTSTIINK